MAAKHIDAKERVINIMSPKKEQLHIEAPGRQNCFNPEITFAVLKKNYHVCAISQLPAPALKSERTSLILIQAHTLVHRLVVGKVNVAAGINGYSVGQTGLQLG